MAADFVNAPSECENCAQTPGRLCEICVHSLAWILWNLDYTTFVWETHVGALKKAADDLALLADRFANRINGTDQPDPQYKDLPGLFLYSRLAEFKNNPVATEMLESFAGLLHDVAPVAQLQVGP
jgi:hypothetical protein